MTAVARISAAFDVFLTAVAVPSGVLATLTTLELSLMGTHWAFLGLVWAGVFFWCSVLNTVVTVPTFLGARLFGKLSRRKVLWLAGSLGFFYAGTLTIGMGETGAERFSAHYLANIAFVGLAIGIPGGVISALIALSGWQHLASD